ncbi:MAG: ATP-binding cassette domain-containing protein [Thermoleophilia bacterium]
MRLRLDQVSFAYQQGTAFETPGIVDVSLAIEPGERVGIAGPVGSGKSTLLAVLGGIVPPDSGNLVVDGAAIEGRNRVERGSIGVAFQSPENSLFEKSVFDDVGFAPRSLGFDDQETRRRVSRALATVGLDEDAFGPRNPFSLSSGEQRRVALAGVLALEPQVLVLDEPTAYLDPVARQDIIARLVDLNRERGTAIVMVGHEMDELAVFAERLIVMDAGRKVADGPAGELLADEALMERHGLEAPSLVRLSRLLSVRSGRPVASQLDEGSMVDTLLAVLGKEGLS